jgi:antitoxin (DNA-binding transcriptional repressor) of toxin-antitoxin stability system
MNRVTVAEAGRDFAGLVSRVCAEGVGVELQQGDHVIAYLTPASPQSPLKVENLKTFVEGLPKLGDDADAFSDDVRAIRRSFPAEATGSSSLFRAEQRRGTRTGKATVTADMLSFHCVPNRDSIH